MKNFRNSESRRGERVLTNGHALWCNPRMRPGRSLYTPPLKITCDTGNACSEEEHRVRCMRLMGGGRRELFTPGYGTGFKMWIAVEALRCPEAELGRIARKFRVPLAMVQRCRRIAFRALENAFWKEDPCRLVPPPRRSRQSRVDASSVEKEQEDPIQFVERLLQRVHTNAVRPGMREIAPEKRVPPHSEQQEPQS